MKKLIIILITIYCSSCATIINTPKQTVSFNSEPSEATILVDGNIIGKTPMTAKIKRKSSSVTMQKDNYETQIKTFNKDISPLVVGNILIGGIIGIIIDICTGSYYNLDDNIYLILKQK